MSVRIVNNRRLADALTKRGLIPTGCALIDVQIAPTGGLKIRYEKFIHEDEFALFADALKEVADDLAKDSKP